MFLRPFETILWLRNALSLFNLILLLWLGLTVLLNADRRRLGIWVASGGLLIGAAFFVSHSALPVVGFNTTRSSAWWFFSGVLAAVVLPLGWYLTVLWYVGFWTARESQLRRRQRWPLIGMLSVMLFGVLGLVAKVYRFRPIFSTIDALLDLTVFGLPLDVLGFIGYVVIIISLSIDALRTPGPSLRPMGEMARSRARPWVAGASLALLATALGVAAALVWVIRNTRVGEFYVLDEAALDMIGRFDLVILCFVAAAVLMVGQAVASYELFTGKTLPRSGLKLYWRRAVIFAAGFSAVTAVFIALDTILIYSVLLTIILMTVFLALLGWRNYADRERYIDSLRPFVTSEGLYDSLLTPTNSILRDAQQPFDALCEDVLACKHAYLIAAGAFAPLVQDLAYGSTATSLPTVSHLLPRFTDPTVLYEQIGSESYDDIAYAVPLWGSRGLIGILLVGPKRNDGLFTQEELEIARATCERLIDTQASAAVSMRLMQMQRERMAQTLVMDQHSRRVLHDEVLPLIQTSMIALSGEDKEASMQLLSDAHKEISNLLHEMPMVATPDLKRLGLIGALKRVVEVEFSSDFDKVDWVIDDGVEQQLEQLTQISAETAFYAARETLRNAAKYAKHPNRPLEVTISAYSTQSDIHLGIADNGIGITDKAAQIGETQLGAGQGMALHSTLMAVIGGSLSVESSPQQFTRVDLLLPTG